MKAKSHEKLPQYQQPFRAWLEEVKGNDPTAPQCVVSTFKKVAGSNATHDRLECTVCAHRISVRKEKKKPSFDPESCPHARLTRLGSSKKYVNYWCTDCQTTVERVTREQAEHADRLATQMFLASTRIKESIGKLTKDPQLSTKEAMPVIRMFEQQASARVASLGDGGTGNSSELVAELQDIIDRVLLVNSAEGFCIPG